MSMSTALAISGMHAEQGRHLNPSLDDIEALEKKLLPLEQIDCPLIHKFAPGVYLREIFMPKGSFIIGQQHKTEHFNIVLSGRAMVLIEGHLQEIKGPCTFVSHAGVRKMLHILEDMRWATVHPTDEKELDKLDELLIVKSGAYLEYHNDMKRLMEGGS